MSRDWTATLFPASYKGVPFWIERDHAVTGRRVAVTPYANSEIWDNEDLGSTPLPFEISGYLSGDDSDARISALEQVCGAKGAGVLVLPAQGPVQARCLTIKRDRQRDRMGRFGFEARFIAEPGLSASQPAEWLAQLTFDAVGSLSAASGGFLNEMRL